MNNQHITEVEKLINKVYELQIQVIDKDYEIVQLQELLQKLMTDYKSFMEDTKAFNRNMSLVLNK